MASLPLTAIRTDGGTQSRELINPFTVAAYSADMQAGAHFPPVTVFYDGAEYWLADGFHRVEAAQQLGQSTIAADVRQGTRRDAVLFAVSANATHGLPRTPSDRRRAIDIMLTDPEWMQWSDRAISRHCHVDHKTVAGRRLALTGEFPSDQRIYTTKQGTVSTMKTARIGKPAVPNAAILFLQEHAPEDMQESLADGTLSITEAYQQTRQAVARERVPEPVATPVPLPTARYRCLVIDPPWPMKKIEREERPDQGVELDYPVMSLEAIAALPVAALAEPEGCHLYLWTTQKLLPDALALLTGWGFRYQCLLTWVKPSGFTPFSWMYNTEHVIFARRGNLPLERMGLKLSFDAPVTRHSEKPAVFYERVAQASPGPRLELFARQPREGFAVWGNEVIDYAS